MHSHAERGNDHGVLSFYWFTGSLVFYTYALRQYFSYAL
jgi:hypothetical protein